VGGERKRKRVNGWKEDSENDKSKELVTKKKLSEHKSNPI
jgi:hypothetical protein